MRRALKWIGGIVAGLVALVALLVVLVFVLANVSPGRQAIAWLTPRLTGDTVRLAGFSGRFPDALRVAHVELRDTQGVYATVDDFAFDWSPLQLLHRRIQIDRLAARRIEAIRMPVSSSSSGSSGLPMPVTLRQLQVEQLDVGAALAGKPLSVALDGSGEMTSPNDLGGSLNVHGLSGTGTYTVTGAASDTRLQARLHADEPAHGLIAGVAGLPDLGAIALDATLDGPRNAVVTNVSLAAGPLHATVGGTVDLQASAADLTVSASAPAMQPRPDVGWQSVAVDAHVQGPFERPDAVGHIRIEALSAATAGIASLNADVSGNAGQIRLNGEATGLRLPGPDPDLLAGDPLAMEVDARLDAPDRPVHVILRHKLFTADATAQTGAHRSLDATVRVADLAPFAAIGHVDLKGRSAATVHATMDGNITSLAADATIGLTGGQPQATALVGDDGKVSLAATIDGSDVSLTRLSVNGRAISLDANGKLAADRLDLAWTLAVSDLAAAEPSIGGQLKATGTVSGATDDLSLAADITGNVAARGMSSGGIDVKVAANGLPNRPSGRITAQGELLGAPVDLAVALNKTDDGLAVDIERAAWKSLDAGGAVQVPLATMVPVGDLHLSMTRLADLEPLIGRPVGGSVRATFSAKPGDTLPVLNAQIDAQSLRFGTLGGTIRATANGTPAALAVKLAADMPNLQGAPVRLTSEAQVDATNRTVSVSALQADWRQQVLRLLAPVRIGFADGVTIDRLRLGLRQAVLEVSGRAGETLDITASLHNLPADIVAIVAPDFAADGSVQADARITGTSARPSGRVSLNASGLRLRSGPGRAIPAASITATANLNGSDAQIDARATAGRSRLTIDGRAPLGAAGALNLRTSGALDLARLDPIVAAGGRRVRGQLTLDGTVTGTVAAPNVVGTVQLAGGEVQDYGAGVHLTDIEARVQGSGAMLRITQFTAKAGEGTISITGSVGIAAPGLPVDLTLTARNARPLSSDLITAVIDADLTLRGEAKAQLAAGGEVRVRRADIQIPERIPASIAVLPISRPGAKPAPSAPPVEVALNLTLRAPRQVFIRGRGVNAEFGGEITLTGTSTAPQPRGGFELIRGDISLAGRTLNFTEGRISFNGGSITDPALRLVATSVSGNITATLEIGGTAHDPKIILSSVPALPQDEVLAHLLFGTGVGKLGAVEVAEIAAGLATLTGAGGGVGDPLNSVRQGLGLDRLSVTSGASGSPALEAGRYIAPRVYLGAKQSTSGSTQATVQYDITKGLKLQATAGTGSNSATGTVTPQDDPGSSVGLTYQFEY